MKNVYAWLVVSTMLACAAAIAPTAIAQESPQAEQPEKAKQPEQPQASDDTTDTTDKVEVEKSDEQSDDGERHRTRIHYRGNGNVIFHIGDDSVLRAGESADGVIAIFGSATSAGDVWETVASIFGDTRVTGPAGSAVAVFGNTYVNSEIREDAVAVFGDLELGPNAEIIGEAVSVGGTIHRDPGAKVHGGTQEVAFGQSLREAGWLRSWIEHCLLLGRPLAFEADLGWAWGVACGFLGLYVLIALLFGGAVEKCVETLETRPGESVVAALLTVLLTPVLFVLLLITVVGIGLLPFLAVGLFCVGLFGKAVMLGALGRRVTRLTGIAPLSHIAFGVVVGGILVLGLYVVPFMGFIAYKVIGILGTGVVVYTLILALRQRAQSRPAPQMQTQAAGAAAFSNPGVDTVNSTTEPPFAAGAAPAAAGPAPASAAYVAATTLPRAGFWLRMGALLIDSILISIVMAILDPPGEFFWIALAIYGALMWKLRGTTVGGIVCNIQVVRLDGGEINWDTAIVRMLSCFLSLACAGLGFIWIAFDPQRQAWHDKIAGTVVVRTPRNVTLV